MPLYQTYLEEIFRLRGLIVRALKENLYFIRAHIRYTELNPMKVYFYKTYLRISTNKIYKLKPVLR